jgi:hypothetical protein
MNLYSDSAQVGFLVGMYFMASAIVALTLVYFSRPKPKKGDSQNKPDPLAQTNLAEVQNQPGLPENHPRAEDLEARPKPEAVSSQPGPEAVSRAPEPSVGKEGPALNKAENANPEDPGIKESPGQGGEINKEENLKQGSPLITVTNAPKPQAGPAPPVAPAQDKLAAEGVKPVNTKEEKPQTNAVPAAAAGQAVTENQGKSENEAKPKTANSKDDFSELFTEDTEESEASRLAKELEDIDTEDILQTSQDLISQFKRGKV